MDLSGLNLGLALWLGLLTAISPCPMATNIAAVSYLARDVRTPGRVLVQGVLYALGRTATYVGLGVLLAGSLLSLLETAEFLQLRMTQFTGPVLIVIGLFLLGLFRLPGIGSGRLQRWGAQTAGVPAAGPFLLGLFFALSFCPVSAGLFFGSLLPLSVGAGSILLLPALFGIGTALPVLAFAFLIAVGVNWVSTGFERVQGFERWARRVTAVVFLGAGVYLTVVNTLGYPDVWSWLGW